MLWIKARSLVVVRNASRMQCSEAELVRIRISNELNSRREFDD
jgi:hypothetical protein